MSDSMNWDAWQQSVIRLSIGTLDRQIRLESLPGRNQEFHRVEGILG